MTLHPSLPKSVVIHPLVLLSVVDHYNRIAKDTQKRVVGVLLGSYSGKILDVSNAFAVPFEQDEKDAQVWFLDHNYLETMIHMFTKVNAKEKIVGWYHTGPKLKPNDMEIHQLLRQYHANPVLVIVDVQPGQTGLPTEAYMSVEEIHDDGTPTSKTFEHIPSEIGAEEAEEIGVEHLLRDLKDNHSAPLVSRISQQLSSVAALNSRLLDIQNYLVQILDEKLPVNNQILYLLQDIFNLLPNLNLDSMIHSFTVKTNDQFLLVYLSSMIRSVISLHDLIKNKISNLEMERKNEKLEEQKDEVVGKSLKRNSIVKINHKMDVD
eukprot:Sdes_comp18724_c0_seq2m9058